MAGESREQIEQFRLQQAMRRTIREQNREGRAKVDRALAEMQRALAQYAQEHPSEYERERKRAQQVVINQEALKELTANERNEAYTGLTPEQEQQAIALETARNLQLITVTPIEGEAREEQEEEPQGPLEPIRIQIEQLPGAPALQPPPQIAKPVQTKLPEVRGFLERLPTPGSIQYLVLGLGFFLLAIVPMLVFNGKSYTRLQLLWRAATGGVALPKTAYRLAIEQRIEETEARRRASQQLSDVLRADATAAFWGADLAINSFFGGGPDAMGTGAGQYAGYPTPQGITGPLPGIANPGGGWLYDDHGMLVLEHPAGSQNGRSAKRRRGLY